MYTLLCRNPQRKHYFAYTDVGASARGNVYASMKKSSAKATFCVYRGWMYTLLHRNPQQKHHFAYTEIGASARGDVYASVQKLSVKTLFCVYRCQGREGVVYASYSEAINESIILRIQMSGTSARSDVYASMQKLSVKALFCVYRYRGVDVYASAQKSSAKAFFCVYRNRDVCKERCIRFHAEALSESILLRIQIPGVDVYASMKKPSAKSSFCVYRGWDVCKERCIRFYEEVFSEIIILRIQILGHLRGAMYTHLCRRPQRKHHLAYTDTGGWMYTHLCRIPQ